MKHSVAIIKHTSVKNNILPWLRDWQAYESVHVDVDIEILGAGSAMPVGYYTATFGLEWKSFGIFPVSEGKSMDLYGLTTPQEWIREEFPFLSSGVVNTVIFIYQKNASQHNVTSWCRFGTLYPDTDFIEIALPVENTEQEFMRIITHEIRHAWVNRSRRRGIPTPDVMDMTPVENASGTIRMVPYYKEFVIDHPDGNRAMQNKLFKWKQMEAFLPTQKNPTWVHWLVNILRLVVPIEKPQVEKPQVEKPQVEKPQVEKPQVEKPQITDNISLWADAIQQKEGWYVGSCSYRGNNPGNFRYANQKTAIGTHLCGASGRESRYAMFPDYKTGRKYLEDILTSHAMGGSELYNRKAKEIGKRNSGDMTLYEWAQVYAPSGDSNNPRLYAEFVVKYLREKGVDITIDKPIKTLLQY